MAQGNEKDRGLSKKAEDNVITDESVAVIAGVAAMEVDGMAELSSGIAGNIMEALGNANPTKGVKVQVTGQEAEIDLYIVVKYGYRIPEVAWNVQEKVKSTVETLTSVFVTAVNIHVQGIDFSGYKEKEEGEGEK